MNQHQRHLRQAAEQAFADSLSQLEEWLMADEADDESQESHVRHQQSPAPSALIHQTDDSSIRDRAQDKHRAQSQITPPPPTASRPSSESSSASQKWIAPGSKENSDHPRRARTHPSREQLTHAKRSSTSPQRDRLQAFADAAEDIERFIQNRR